MIALHKPTGLEFPIHGGCQPLGVLNKHAIPMQGGKKCVVALH